MSQLGLFPESSVLHIEDADQIVDTMIFNKQHTMNDLIIYSVTITRFNPKEDKYEPYSDIKDMHLKFAMLDPRIRTALRLQAGKNWPSTLRNSTCLTDLRC
ncbi:hypothetical protein IW261DRAFT_1610383 [Armillaria novae-zelandiae]|uniref:OST48 middle domain-containing protein n=1 Tax=Armillaria novae-zelandiae TaxID=153914 RepID=A0AA39UDM0_9AGAR|nr:hypothetical protein IW261DRAFT_1610383 [Armillaria novae-zelandiae]